MKVKSETEVAQSCLTLSNPMGCSPPGSLVRGIFQARVLELGANIRDGEEKLMFVERSTLTSLSLFTFHFHALEKEMATHSGVLA